MARQVIAIGSSANDGTGDPGRTAFTKTNENFEELFKVIPATSGITDNIRISGNTVSTANRNGDLTLAPNGTGKVIINNEITTSTADANITLNPNGSGKVILDEISISRNVIESTRSNDNISLVPNGTGKVLFNSERVNFSTIGYTSAPTVTIEPPPSGGTLARATATINGISAITINNEGSGYTSPPTVTITRATGDTTGTGAMATATLNGGRVTGITITDHGSDYTLPPDIAIRPATGDTTGTGAMATASIEGGGLVTAITISERGAGYTSAPKVTIMGGATAMATVANGEVTNITITNSGKRAPTRNGSSGDKAGDMVIYNGNNTSYFYICFKDYVNNSTPIWRRFQSDSWS